MTTNRARNNIAVHDSYGFSMLEVILVIIILGILTSLALPKLFSVIEQSRAAEAHRTFGSIRRGLEGCHARTNDFSMCDDNWNLIGMENPNNLVGAHFNYVVTGIDSEEYIVKAQRNTFNGGDGASQFFYIQNSSEIWYYGTGAYESLTYQPE